MFKRTFLTLLLSSIAQIANSQIIPDQTLPNNSLIVSPHKQTFLINGGTQLGTNLFHSFQEFNISSGQLVLFNNGLDVANIFSRVTGNNISLINGTLAANGMANLFLINPNGVIFGQNAQLLLGGSFFGTTASQVNFADGGLYNSLNPRQSSLTVSAPIGLQFNAERNGQIIVKNTGHDLVLFGSSFTQRTGNSLGLFIQPNQTFSLIGGEIVLDGALINSLGGNIEISSVKSGTVTLNLFNTFPKLDNSFVSEFNNIYLLNKSLIDASGLTKSGNIFLTGNNITLQDSSVILIQNIASGLSSITLNSQGNIVIKDAAIDANISSSIRSEALSNFEGANLKFKGKSLELLNGGQIVAQTFGEARGGTIEVDLKEALLVDGVLSFSPNILSIISTSTFGKGDAGTIKVDAQTLNISRGGSLSSGTFAQGNSGNIFLSISSLIALKDISETFTNPSLVSTNSFSEGNAGNITITTSQLILENGGQINSSTIGKGNGGTIAINASDFVHILGNENHPSQINSAAEIINNPLRELLEFLGEIPAIPSGESGNITITTSDLSLKNKGAISVRNDGIGRGGSLNLTAKAVSLDNQSQFTASTASGQGGNISLSSAHLFLNNSQITATAGGSGNGGNITLKTNSLFLLNNSAITANAFAGNGGNILINTDVLFQDPSSSITASSELGVNGVVKVNSEVNLLTIPIQTVNLNLASTQLSVNCTAVELLSTGELESLGESRFVGKLVPSVARKFPANGLQVLPNGRWLTVRYVTADELADWGCELIKK